jgi:hypothetical protein
VVLKTQALKPAIQQGRICDPHLFRPNSLCISTVVLERHCRVMANRGKQKEQSIPTYAVIRGHTHNFIIYDTLLNIAVTWKHSN